MKFLLQLIVSTLAVFVSAYMLPGVDVNSILTALVVAAVISFLNVIVKPIMIILTIPITIFSFGIFLLFINAFIILIADYLVDGFKVNGFGWAFIFSIVLWLVTMVFESFDKSRFKEEKN